GFHPLPGVTLAASATSPLRLVLGRGTLATARATCDLLRRDIDDWERMTCCAGKGRKPMLLWALIGGMLICVVLLDAFETIVLPRRGARRLRLPPLGIPGTPEPLAPPPRGRRRGGGHPAALLWFFSPVCAPPPHPGVGHRIDRRLCVAHVGPWRSDDLD